jgi:tetratricopeptide (TPR) repeat protein
MASDAWDAPSLWARMQRNWEARRIAAWNKNSDAWSGLLRARGLWLYVAAESEPGEARRWARRGVPVIVYMQSLAMDDQSRFPAVLVAYDPEDKQYLVYTGARDPFTIDGETWRLMRKHAQHAYLYIAPESWDDPAMHAAMLHARGRWWMKDAAYMRAIKDFNRALEQAPDQPDLYVELADAYFFTGDFAQAEPLYRAALALDELNARAMNNLAYMLLSEGRETNEALHLARNAVMRQPDNPRYLHTLGWAHQKNEQKTEAVRAWKRARTRAVTTLSPEEQAAIAWRLARHYSENGQAHLARQVVSDILSLHPGIIVPDDLQSHVHVDQFVPR